MATVWHLLNQKGRDVWSVNPDQTVLEALELMTDKGIGAVIVLENDKIVGIFSERDFARFSAKKGSLSLYIPVNELMTQAVFTVHPDQSIDECMALMTQKHIRHLPVVDKGQLVGLISIGDVVREVISQKEITIHSLENYIMGREYNQ
ncbi:MAG: CBS domain-containing protein [Anaerolineaceae bacterium]|jgi:CBS domain-containing protein